MNNNPESELPWVYDARLKQIIFGEHYGVTEAKQVSEDDATYIVHACNAYPKLIEMVREAAWIPTDQTAPSENKTVVLMAIDLLRKLGEDV
jgi:hypothetical protein